MAHRINKFFPTLMVTSHSFLQSNYLARQLGREKGHCVSFEGTANVTRQALYTSHLQGKKITFKNLNHHSHADSVSLVYFHFIFGPLLE